MLAKSDDAFFFGVDTQLPPFWSVRRREAKYSMLTKRNKLPLG